MNTDKTTKRLLLAIALGLWANAAVQFVRPADLHAKSAVDMESDVRQIKSTVNAINLGICLNSKIC